MNAQVPLVLFLIYLFLNLATAQRGFDMSAQQWMNQQPSSPVTRAPTSIYPTLAPTSPASYPSAPAFGSQLYSVPNDTPTASPTPVAVYAQPVPPPYTGPSSAAPNQPEPIVDPMAIAAQSVPVPSPHLQPSNPTAAPVETPPPVAVPVPASAPSPPSDTVTAVNTVTPIRDAIQLTTPLQQPQQQVQQVQQDLAQNEGLNQPRQFTRSGSVNSGSAGNGFSNPGSFAGQIDQRVFSASQPSYPPTQQGNNYNVGYSNYIPSSNYNQPYSSPSTYGGSVPYSGYAGQITPQFQPVTEYIAPNQPVPISTPGGIVGVAPDAVIAGSVGGVGVGQGVVSGQVGQSSGYQQLQRDASIYNTADSTLATCAAYVCVEFVDSTSYGTNTYNTFTSQANQASAGQGSIATQSVSQIEMPIYSYPGSFTQYALYGQFPTNQFTSLPFYKVAGVQQQSSAAYGESQSSQATTVHNDYFNDNHQIKVSGKKCGTYVCAHSTDSATTSQNANFLYNQGNADSYRQRVAAVI